MKKLILCVISVGLLVLDLWSKAVVQTSVGVNERIQVIPNFFYITYLKNTGSAWSLFEGLGPIVIVVSIVVACVIAYYFVKQTNMVLLTGLALAFAGNLGNLYDRVVFNFVRDMFSFNLFGYWFPVFNVADACMVIGVALVFIYTYLEDKKGGTL
ncbi:hypothetical protein AOC36_07705 [Erysipelothrix larvae]|uniref:Lipoprotein signal peptidase n=1 Tax=Erysipelothrix larvae TaxID=1514105 RepID=A0A120JTT5_9FIRM|nr:signal peptidase II [Erysipelothrix larvae]AMC93871.1 hypothetical protein AOC36_07705 [Erysipelothrix larvae]